jgi:hypothetical protein
MAPRQRDLRTAQTLVYGEDVALQPQPVCIDLAGHLLGGRQRRLDLAEVDAHAAADLTLARRSGLLYDARDDVALTAGVLAVGDLVLGVAKPLQDHLPRGGGGDATEARRRVVVLAQDVAFRTDLLREHGDLTGTPVEDDTCVLLRTLCAVVRREHRGFECFHDEVE